jgi:hypothetical protein
MPTREQKQQGQDRPAHGRRLSLRTMRLRLLTMHDLSEVHGGNRQVPLSPSNGDSDCPTDF